MPHHSYIYRNVSSETNFPSYKPNPSAGYNHIFFYSFTTTSLIRSFYLWFYAEEGLSIVYTTHNSKWYFCYYFVFSVVVIVTFIIKFCYMLIVTKHISRKKSRLSPRSSFVLLVHLKSIDSRSFNILKSNR